MKLHKLNRNFTWRKSRPPFEIITEEQSNAYNELGGFVLQGAFSKGEISELTQVLDPLELASNELLRQMQDKRLNIARADEIVFRPHVVSADTRVKKFACNPLLAGLCRDLVGLKPRLYWDQIVYKRPETAVEFPWHQDNGYTFVQPQQYLTCWIALTDATRENGCPWLAPGLHLQGTLHHDWTDLGYRCLDDDDLEPIPMELTAGSIAVFSSLSPHRTGPNLTQKTRKAYILQYADDGAVIHLPDGSNAMANDPERQFLV